MLCSFGSPITIESSGANLMVLPLIARVGLAARSVAWGRCPRRWPKDLTEHRGTDPHRRARAGAAGRGGPSDGGVQLDDRRDPRRASGPVRHRPAHRARGAAAARHTVPAPEARASAIPVLQRRLHALPRRPRPGRAARSCRATPTWRGRRPRPAQALAHARRPRHDLRRDPRRPRRPRPGPRCRSCRSSPRAPTRPRRPPAATCSTCGAAGPRTTRPRAGTRCASRSPTRSSRARASTTSAIDATVARRVEAWPDITARTNVPEGNVYHVDMSRAATGALRPALGFGGYRTPVPGPVPDRRRDAPRAVGFWYSGPAGRPGDSAPK